MEADLKAQGTESSDEVEFCVVQGGGYQEAEIVEAQTKEEESEDSDEYDRVDDAEAGDAKIPKNNEDSESEGDEELELEDTQQDSEEGEDDDASEEETDESSDEQTDDDRQRPTRQPQPRTLKEILCSLFCFYLAFSSLFAFLMIAHGTGEDLDAPKVTFHPSKTRKSANCRLLRKEVLDNNPNVVNFVFEFDYERVSANLSGKDWEKYDYSFEDILGFENQNGDLEYEKRPSSEWSSTPSSDWDSPRTKTHQVSVNINVWDKSEYRRRYFGTILKIHTKAPIGKYVGYCDIQELKCDFLKHMEAEMERQRKQYKTLAKIIG